MHQMKTYAKPEDALKTLWKENGTHTENEHLHEVSRHGTINLRLDRDEGKDGPKCKSNR
jgi:hypothetical protein